MFMIIKKLSLRIKRLTKELGHMSEVIEKMHTEISKIAARNYNGNEDAMRKEVARAIDPVSKRVDDLEQVVLDALEALNNDDAETAGALLGGAGVEGEPSSASGQGGSTEGEEEEDTDVEGEEGTDDEGEDT